MRVGVLTAVLLLAALCQAKSILPPSVCPDVFQYEKPTTTNTEDDRWYGVLTLNSTDYDLKGVWLRVIFDKPFLELGNWFGEVDTSNGKNYLIKDPSFVLEANKPHTVRFYVRYDPKEPAPVLTQFRLNGRIVCGKDDSKNDAVAVIDPKPPKLYTNQFFRV